MSDAEAHECSWAVLCEEAVEDQCPRVLCECISILPRPSFLLGMHAIVCI